jgi:NAD+ synthase
MKLLNTSQAQKFVALSVDRLSEYIEENNIRTLVLGVSGGIDSAVVAVIGLKTKKQLLAKNFETNYKYYFLDCESDQKDITLAQELAGQYQFKLNYLDLNSWYRSSPLLELIGTSYPQRKIAQGNIKCRLRMISLYNIAKLSEGIVLDTDDFSEELMGFWTLHGDVGDVKIIQHLTKTEVYDIGEFLGIPQSILTSEPGDGLGVTINNIAKDQLQCSYYEIEYILSKFIQAGFDYNGSVSQLDDKKCINLIISISQVISVSKEKVSSVIFQSLKTAYKRKYGDNVKHLLSNRKELGLPEFGTQDFSRRYRYK